MKQMTMTVPGRVSYLRAALSNQYNLILLAGSASFSAALASWAPLVSGIVGEAMWLVTGPRLRSFRRHTDATLDRESDSRVIDALGPEYMDAVRAVQAAVQRMVSTVLGRGDLTAEQRFQLERRLRPLVHGYANACNTHQRLRRALTESQPVVPEVGRLQQALAGEADLGVRASLRRALSVAERRIRYLEGNETACTTIHSGLRNFEQLVAALEIRAAGPTGALELSTEIDAARGFVARLAATDVERESERADRISVLPPALN
jgi:hypothetical protein